MDNNINNKSARNRSWFLIAVLAAGVFIRFYDLDGESLWLDECLSMKVAFMKNIFKIILQRYTSYHPPFFYLTLRFWVNFFGKSEYATRFLSAAFSSLALVMTYRLSKKIFDRETGIIAAFLLAFSTFHVTYAQEVRMYALTTLLALCSMYYFYSLIKHGGMRHTLLYILFTFMLLATHYSGTLILLAQNLFFVYIYIKEKRKTKVSLVKWLSFMGLLFILFLPISKIWHKELKVIQNVKYWIPKPNLYSIFDSFITYSGSKVLLFLFTLSSGLGYLSFRQQHGKVEWKKGTPYYFLLIWMACPILVPFVISFFAAPMYFTKYTILASIAYYMLVAKGIRNINRLHLRGALIFFISLYCALALSKYFYRVIKPQWREASAFLQEKAQPGDLVVFNDRVSRNDIFNFYYKTRDDIVTTILPGPWADNKPFVILTKDNVEMLWDKVSHKDRFWVVLSHTQDYNRFFQQRFSSDYSCTYYRNYFAVDVYLLERKTPGNTH